MIVRKAKQDSQYDYRAVFDLVKEMVQASVFAYATPSPEKIKTLFQFSKTGTFFAIADDKPVGFISIIITPFFFSDVERASDLGFYIQPSHRGSSAAVRLLKAAEQWAIERGCKELYMGHSVGGKVDEMKSFYLRNGYKVGGFNSMKVF